MIMPPLLIAALGLAAAPPPDASPPEERVSQDAYAQNVCIQCHRNLAGRSAEIVDLEWTQSVHYQNNVACDGCHGGDPTVTREQFPSDQAWKQASHLARNPEFLSMQAGQGVFIHIFVPVFPGNADLKAVFAVAGGNDDAEFI